MDIVSFPRMGIRIPVTEDAFSIFGIAIKWYAIIITTGICLAWLYVGKRSRSVGLHPDSVFDVIFGGLIGGIIGARAYFVIFDWGYYSQNLLQVFNTRSGGLAFYGGLIGGVLVGVLVARKKKVAVLPVLDLVGPAFLIGQSIGRWGNFVNEEAFGRNTTLPWGMTSPKIEASMAAIKRAEGPLAAGIDPTQTVHPCFLYESIWCAIGFLVLHFYSKKHRKFDGEIFLLYLAWYGFGRFFIEGLRMDSLYAADSVRISQLLSAVFCIGALIIWYVMRKKVKADPERYPLYKDTPASKEEIARIDEKTREKKSGKKDKEAGKEAEKKADESDTKV